ncbi:diguanylate cyclase/phosphodiesterase [Crenobacter luteus]|uniref:GGDEF domain-containing protein n=1 Tax=Crenobacter luteus TaxID=1452487 RepID=UPI001042D6EA|nr:GGDEF domain-containing protein [Crenobacter luteus]TCP13812.1 diguanylate cyclase/phosphodiesterase [Crenobacter luteus]
MTDLAAGPTVRCTELELIIHERRLSPVFQPIVDLESGRILGYEGLIRGPSNSSLHSPLNLFSRAAECNLTLALDRACRRVTVERFVELALPGRLFLNISPDSLLAPEHRRGETLAFVAMLGLSPDRIVMELTETKPNAAYEALKEATDHYRDGGFHIALDDLGEGFSNLRLWSELRPDFVKLDKHFVQNIHHDPLKEQFVRSLVDIARKSGARLVAEGIESVAELRTLRRLGVQYGQGYLIARPSPVPALELQASIDGVAWPGGRGRLGQRRQPAARDLLVEVAPMSVDAPTDEAYRRFADDAALFAIPVLEGEVPVGLLRRHHLLESFARPFNRELYGKKPCRLMMDKQPLIVAADLKLNELSGLVVAAERRYLIDGFILAEDGKYLGMGTGYELMRKLNELQVSAARYANPLTGLPGNVPINETIDRLIETEQPFMVAYVDLDHFKPFNDLYGYAAGDELIELLGRLLAETADPERDFVGHVGGDDFVVLLQSPDWRERLEGVIAAFDAAVPDFFTAEHRAAGGFELPGRGGETTFFPLTGVSIGALRVVPGAFPSHHEVAAAAAEAKRQAKRRAGSSLHARG